MTLAEFMKANDLDDAAMALIVGSVSSFAVRKWRYGERVPRPRQMARIVAATNGKVSADDFMQREPAA